MNYPQASLWTKLEKVIEEWCPPEPKLVQIAPRWGRQPSLSVPADWPEDKQLVFARRWAALHAEGA